MNFVFIFGEIDYYFEILCIFSYSISYYSQFTQLLFISFQFLFVRRVFCYYTEINDKTLIFQWNIQEYLHDILSKSDHSSWIHKISSIYIYCASCYTTENDGIKKHTPNIHDKITKSIENFQCIFWNIVSYSIFITTPTLYHWIG